MSEIPPSKLKAFAKLVDEKERLDKQATAIGARLYVLATEVPRQRMLIAMEHKRPVKVSAPIPDGHPNAWLNAIEGRVTKVFKDSCWVEFNKQRYRFSNYELTFAQPIGEDE